MSTTASCGVLAHGLWFVAGAVTATLGLAATVLLAIWFVDDRPPARKPR